MYLKKIFKIPSYILSKITSLLQQREYTLRGISIKYIHKEFTQSDTMLIVFSAFPGQNQGARYNYMRTLEPYKAHQLFILDDFGFKGRGAYYLAENGDFTLSEAVSEFIEEFANKFNIKKRIYIGSSKGAYAALFFGIENNGSSIIAGAPQYRLGNYLNLPGHEKILEAIMGNKNIDSIQHLNNLLEIKLNSAHLDNTKIFLHYSENEETYSTDLSPLIENISKLNSKNFFDKSNYKNHSELVNYFPIYLRKVLKKSIPEQN